MSNNIVDVSVVRMRAREMVSRGNVGEAIALLGDVLKVDPHNALALADRGTTYAMLKKFDVAQKDLEMAIALGHVEAPTYAALGTVYFELNHPEKSLDLFARAIELDPTYPFSYYNRASVFQELNNDEAAVADLKTCLRFNPDERLMQLIRRRLEFLEMRRAKGKGPPRLA